MGLNANRIRRYYPELFGIRKYLQHQKVRRVKKLLLPLDIVKGIEELPISEKKKLLNDIKVRGGDKLLKPTIIEAENILKDANELRGRSDKENLIIDMLFCRLAYGFLPSEYVCFELEKKSFKERMEYASDVDMNVFGYTVNNIREMQWILDKADSYYKFKKFFKRDVIVIENESDFEKFDCFIQKHQEIVVKKAFSSMGKGTQLIKIDELEMKPKEYFLSLIKSGKYLIEEKIIQRTEMSKYNKTSVNTVRCITFKIENKIVFPYAFMRNGREGSFVDNGGMGGLLIGINPCNGEVVTDGVDEFNNRYTCHPDSKIPFIGNKIPEWDKLLSICKNAHLECTKDIGYLSWDLALTDQGWDLVEVNEVGQFIGPQATFKKGIKKELYNYMEKMK